MVYQGRPSRGCANCKKSHIKCDEAKPNCSLCVKRKLACPGYRDSFDLILRDQTVTVSKNIRRKYTKAVNANGHEHEKRPKVVEVTVTEQAIEVIEEQYDEKKSLTTTLTPSLGEDGVQVALGFFFSCYVLFDRHPEASRGFLELLPWAFLNADPGSVLALSTKALAMTILGGRSRNRSLAWKGRQAFGESLITLKETLKDPIKSKTDETLMGVLMTGMCEVSVFNYSTLPFYICRMIASITLETQGQVTLVVYFKHIDLKHDEEHHGLSKDTIRARIDLLSIKDGVVPTKVHTKGALALLKHRGKDNFANSTAQSLLMAIWTQIVSHSTVNSHQFCSDLDDPSSMGNSSLLKFGPLNPPEPFPAEWVESMRNAPMNSAAHLTVIGEECTKLKSAAMEILNAPDATQEDLVELFIVASMVDRLLTEWLASLPSEWWPQPAADNSPEALRRFGAWGHRMDVYIDIWVACTWNAHRLLRLDVQGILMAITNRGGIGDGFQALKESQKYLLNMQQLVDEVCFSVPYMMGDKWECGVENPAITFPWYEGSTPPATHKIVAQSLGGWYLFSRLCGCLSLEPYASSYVTIVEAEQRRWIMDKMDIIKGTYGLSMADPWLVSAIGLKYIAL